MKRAVSFWGVMMLLTIGLIFLYEAQAGEPKMLIPETTFDFGLIPGGNVVSHQFLVKNVGTDTLEIQKVRPG